MPGVMHDSDLLARDGKSWDVAKVRTMFPPDEADQVVQIDVGGPGAEDYIAWNYTNNATSLSGPLII